MKRRLFTLLIALVMVFAAFPQSTFAAVKDTGVKGRSVLIEGDSIQAMAGKFLEKTADRLGAKKIVNKSRSGATFAYNKHGNVGTNSVYYRIKKMSDKQLRKYRYIFIGAGTNDWFSWSSIKYANNIKSTNPATIEGGVNLTIRRIQAANPKAKIIIVSPIYRYHASFAYTLRRDCDKRKNKYGRTLAKYRKAIEKTAAQYENVYVVSGKDISTKKEVGSLKYTQDYLHPREGYAKTLAKRTAAILRKMEI